MFNDHLYFKIHQSRHAELIRQGEAQRLAQSLIPKHQTRWATVLSTSIERLDAWWEGIKRQLKDTVVRKQPSVSDPY